MLPSPLQERYCFTCSLFWEASVLLLFKAYHFWDRSQALWCHVIIMLLRVWRT